LKSPSLKASSAPGREDSPEIRKAFSWNFKGSNAQPSDSRRATSSWGETASELHQMDFFSLVAHAAKNSGASAPSNFEYFSVNSLGKKVCFILPNALLKQLFLRTNLKPRPAGLRPWGMKN